MSLSDKRGAINIDELGIEVYAYKETDVREAVRELKEAFTNKWSKSLEIAIHKKVVEIFGEKLI